MFCKNCGAEIPAEAQYACPGCNTPLNDVRPVMSIGTHLAESILVTLFCCMPFGVVAIVYAAKVSGLVAQGRIEEAKAASQSAKKWCWLSFGIGLLVNIIVIFLQVFAAVLSA